jgi:hypothetical protein
MWCHGKPLSLAYSVVATIVAPSRLDEQAKGHPPLEMDKKRELDRASPQAAEH